MNSTKTCAHMLPVPTGPNGERVLLRHDHEEVSVTTIVPHADGKPIPPDRDLIAIQKHPDGSLSCETLWEGAGEASHGPAKVSSPAFRTGWDAIWGKPDREVN
jgi:hypothetical protein